MSAPALESSRVVRPRGARSIDDLLSAARARIVRVGPHEAAARIAAGAVLVDIRPAAQRAAEGEVPGALAVERNVLEWRFDPASDARLAVATGFDVDVIVLCSEGYTSSLAADALRSLGPAPGHGRRRRVLRVGGRRTPDPGRPGRARCVRGLA